MNNMLTAFLTRLGFDDKDSAIYLALAQLGVQPASVIARRCGFDRVTTYKHLKALVQRGFLKTYVRNAIQCFGLEDTETLEALLREQKSAVDELLHDYPTVSTMLQALSDRRGFLPRLQIFEGEPGIRALLRDILAEVQAQGLKRIRMMTSNTFDERLGSAKLSQFVSDFFADARKRGIDVQILEATGTLVPERFRQLSLPEFDPEKFSASKGTTNIFLVGSAVYLACYRDSQIGLKIAHDDMSQIFHFLFDSAVGGERRPQ